MSTVKHLASRLINAKRLDKVCILVQQWCQQTVFVYKSAKYKHINLLKYKYCYLKLWTLHMVHLSKLGCYSSRWVWVRVNVVDVLKMERYPSLQFLLVSRSEINNCWTVLYFTVSFFIDLLPCSDCQILKLFTKLFSILLKHTIV